MSTPPETCPHCGAHTEPRDSSRETGFNGVHFKCGNVKYDGSDVVIRVSTCYERELAALRKHLSDANRGAECNAKVNKELCRQLSASRAECAALRSALESAPEPVCAADSPRCYEIPHMVVNFSAVDRWWVIERRKALSASSEALEAVRSAQDALEGCVASAHPNQKEHPAMFAAWKKAEAALAKLNAAFGAGEEGGSR